jgi:hypothetical protein
MLAREAQKQSMAVVHHVHFIRSRWKMTKNLQIDENMDKVRLLY